MLDVAEISHSDGKIQTATPRGWWKF